MALSVSTDKPVYAPGDPVVATVSGAGAAPFTVTVTAQAGGGTATTQYTVVPPVTISDSAGGTWTPHPDGTFTSSAPASAPSGFGGTEPGEAALAADGIEAISWSGYTWEIENWGTAPGQPKSSQVTEGSDGSVILTASEVNGGFWGAETDSARGDRGLAGNDSTWGYGTYRWVIGTDLSRLAPGLVFGLFTYWATSKGGPPGQKEIDIEFSAPTGGPVIAQCGFYADTAAGITSAVPPYHVLVTGSQMPVKSSPETIAQVTWLPGSIRWEIWYGTDDTLVPDQLVLISEGETYGYTEPFGGNTFSGTAHIPATGGQQVIMNLWSNGQALSNVSQQVVIKSFTYTQPA